MIVKLSCDTTENASSLNVFQLFGSVRIVGMEPMVFAMQRLNKNHTMSDTKRYEIVVCTGKHSRESRLRILPLVPVPQENFARIFVRRIESYLNLRQRGENNNEPPTPCCSRFSSHPFDRECQAKGNKSPQISMH